MRFHVWFAGCLCLLLSACAAYNHSVVIERPSHAVDRVVIIVEQPAFSAPISERDGVLTVNTEVGGAIDRYREGLYQVIRKDFVRVLGDNGIKAMLVFVPPLLPGETNPLARLSVEDGAQWPHALWIRHVKGMASCRRYGSCDAFFQTDAKLFDVPRARMIWDAHGGDGQYYGVQAWKDGRMYRYLLERLAADGMISLNGLVPVIKLSGGLDPYGRVGYRSAICAQNPTACPK